MCGRQTEPMLINVCGKSPTTALQADRHGGHITPTHRLILCMKKVRKFVGKAKMADFDAASNIC